MQEIQNQAISNYQENMQYFQEHHESLYNRLLALDTLLAEGKYPQKYDLEYKDGYFDVIELVSGELLYKQNSEKASEKLAKSVSSRKNDQVFETFYNFSYTQNALEKLEHEDPLTIHATSAHIIDYHDSLVDTTTHMRVIPKFIFLGVGLGFHIPKVLHKTKSNALWVIEDDIELFRLSLFTLNYATTLENAKVHFSIAQNESEFSATFTAFYVDAFVRNHYLKFLSFSSAYEEKIRKIQTLILSRPEVGYPHEHLLYKNTKILSRLNKGYNFLDLSKKEHENFFTDKPFLVIGAGPSLHENIQWLQENHQNFVIISVFAALKTLQKAGISPQIVIQIDEKVTETVNLINSYENFDFLKDSIFIFAASVPDILLETFEKEKIFFIEDRTNYKCNNNSLVSASVGESAYAMALIFNAKNIYILGVDLALSKDGATHAKDHHMKNDIDTQNANKLQTTAGMDDTVFYVKGNLRENVATTPRFSISIPMFNRFTARYKDASQTVYNLCDGAYFENTVPTHIADVTCNDQIDVDNEKIRNLFEHYSEFELTSFEKEKLKQKHQNLLQMYKIIDTFETSILTNKEQFSDAYMQMIDEIVHLEVDELYEILIVYFLNTTSYVVDLFNTQELQNPKKHIKKMKKIIISKLLKIIKFYEDALKKAIDKED